PGRRPQLVERGEGRVHVHVALKQRGLEVLEQLLVDPAPPGDDRVDLLENTLDKTEAHSRETPSRRAFHTRMRAKRRAANAPPNYTTAGRLSTDRSRQLDFQSDQALRYIATSPNATIGT